MEHFTTIEALQHLRINESSVNEVFPNKGESKEDFISRFMKETKDEYPDIKQRYAVANSYWDRRDESITEDDNSINGYYIVKRPKGVNDGDQNRYWTGSYWSSSQLGARLWTDLEYAKLNAKSFRLRPVNKDFDIFIAKVEDGDIKSYLLGESLNESSMLIDEFSISDDEKLKVYWDKNDGYVVEKIYNQGNDLWRTDFKKTFHDELSAKRYFSRAKKKFGVNESVEDKYDESLSEGLNTLGVIRVQLDKQNTNYEEDVEKLKRLAKSYRADFSCWGGMAFIKFYGDRAEIKQNGKDAIWFIDRNIKSFKKYSNDSIFDESLSEGKLNGLKKIDDSTWLYKDKVEIGKNNQGKPPYYFVSEPRSLNWMYSCNLKDLLKGIDRELSTTNEAFENPNHHVDVDYTGVKEFEVLDKIRQKYGCKFGARTVGRIEVVGENANKVESEFGYYQFNGELPESLKEETYNYSNYKYLQEPVDTYRGFDILKMDISKIIYDDGKEYPGFEKYLVAYHGKFFPDEVYANHGMNKIEDAKEVIDDIIRYNPKYSDKK